MIMLMPFLSDSNPPELEAALWTAVQRHYNAGVLEVPWLEAPEPLDLNAVLWAAVVRHYDAGVLQVPWPTDEAVVLAPWGAAPEVNLIGMGYDAAYYGAAGP